MAQQDRIIGYFLDEAQEHLRVIEEALITPKLLSQPAQIKEVFRAAHSIKGGAAMLELDTIQKIGHHFEQAFKHIKEKSLTVDEALQDLMLEGFEILSLAIQLLRQQQDPPADLAQGEVFGKIQSYLNSQIGVAKSTDDTSGFLPDPAIEEVFGTYVNQKLLQFQEASRKPQDVPTIRQELSGICQKIAALGDKFDFAAWANLLRSCQLAINNPQVTVAQLTDVVPNAIKQAQVLVIAGKYHVITSTPELEELIATTPVEENSWLDETNLEVPTALTALPILPIYSGSSVVDVPAAPDSIDDVDEFMQLFDDELPVDGTWVQDEDVLAEEFLQLDNFGLEAVAAADDDHAAMLWNADIAARPITLDEPAFSPDYPAVELAPALNLPQFSFEELGESELVMADELPTAPPAMVSNSVASLAHTDIDWSGLLADIPNEAIVDYSEYQELPVIPAEPNWLSSDVAPAELSIEPVAEVVPDWQEDPFALFSLAASEPAAALVAEDDDLAAFVLEQPVVTDFTTTDFVVANELADADSAILDTSNFPHFGIEDSADTDDMILEILEFDNHQFSFDSSSKPPDDAEIANVFSSHSPSLDDAPGLPTLDELMAQSLPKPVAVNNNIVYLGIEDWQELSIFDDLLADTKTTDVNIADLNQILISCNVDPDLELEDLEDLSDFFASLSQL
jgi:HPt (histidine-containing phosphotransfer) domain-containing protein